MTVTKPGACALLTTVLAFLWHPSRGLHEQLSNNQIQILDPSAPPARDSPSAQQVQRIPSGSGPFNAMNADEQSMVEVREQYQMPRGGVQTGKEHQMQASAASIGGGGRTFTKGEGIVRGGSGMMGGGGGGNPMLPYGGQRAPATPKATSMVAHTSTGINAEVDPLQQPPPIQWQFQKQFATPQPPPGPRHQLPRLERAETAETPGGPGGPDSAPTVVDDSPEEFVPDPDGPAPRYLPEPFQEIPVGVDGVEMADESRPGMVAQWAGGMPTHASGPYWVGSNGGDLNGGPIGGKGYTILQDDHQQHFNLTFARGDYDQEHHMLANGDPAPAGAVVFPKGTAVKDGAYTVTLIPPPQQPYMFPWQPILKSVPALAQKAHGTEPSVDINKKQHSENVPYNTHTHEVGRVRVPKNCNNNVEEPMGAPHVRRMMVKFSNPNFHPNRVPTAQTTIYKDDTTHVSRGAHFASNIIEISNRGFMVEVVRVDKVEGWCFDVDLMWVAFGFNMDKKDWEEAVRRKQQKDAEKAATSRQDQLLG